MKKFNSAKLLTAVIALTLLPKAAPAQIPSSTEPGVIIRSQEEEKRKPSRLEDTVVVPKEETGKGLSATKVFVLKQVILDKPNVYTPEILAGMYGDMIGKEVSFADLNVIAQRVTRRYREDGYIFSRAVLPPQKIVDGIVHLRAVEGRISHVKLVGNYTDKNGLIQKFADKISTSEAANAKEIERYLLLIDDLPGITAKSFIKPAQTPGAGDLIIDVEEDSFEGSVGADNRGSDYIGPYRGTLVGAFNSTFGIHDRTTLRGILASQTRELRFGDIVHEEQIGSEGFKLKGRAAFTGTEPGGNISTLGIQGDSQLYDLEGAYPLIRSRKYNINLLAGLDALNSETDISGIKTAEDRVRSGRLGAQIDFTDPYGVNQFDLSVTHGLSILGETHDGLGRSRVNGEHDFFKGNLTATRVQQLPGLFSLMLSGTGQTSRDPLLASEEFTIGGPSFGRAYDAGELSGDTGWAGAAELRYGEPVATDWLYSYQAYTFVDYGKINNKTPVFGETSSDSLTSAGFGLRANLARQFSGYIELDKPLNKKVTSENDHGSRLFFSVLRRF
jgi:hemolysin activation/secretion protein